MDYQTGRHASRILFTVTNDLTYDQRMHRICSALAEHGYLVELVGRVLPHSTTVDLPRITTKRLRCFFNKGPLFYAEFNIRLLFYLLLARYDVVCSIDLDTLPAGCLATLLRRKKRVFDAHEYFTEVPEVVDRPVVKAIWNALGHFCLKYYKHAYTVSAGLAEIFSNKYHFPFITIRNVPQSLQTNLRPLVPNRQPPFPILYQGALNEGRGIEALLKAMAALHGFELWLAGEGDLSNVLRQQAEALNLGTKVKFLGRIKPAELSALTQKAWLGVNLIENRGLSYYHSLANKFFDSIQAGVPVLTMNFPEYAEHNREHEVAVLLDELNPKSIEQAIQALQQQPELYNKLQFNCKIAADQWVWEREKTILIRFWDELFGVKMNHRNID